MNGNYIKGLVSVVIPTYRRSNSLVKAINSVVNQNYSNIEVLLMDIKKIQELSMFHLIDILMEQQREITE